MTDEEIKAQQSLLEVHRTNARVYYEQKIQLGPLTPPYIISGLELAQKEIREIKLALLAANQPFENLSFDGAPVEQKPILRTIASQNELETALQQLESLPLDHIPEPNNLPPNSRLDLEPNPLFVGREEDFKTLAKQLKQGKVSAIIAGIGGLGKTQLAVELAYRYGQYFAGGVYWVSFANPNTIPNEIAECGRAMGLYDESFKLSQADQVQHTRNAWDSAIPRLLIFDNCDEDAQLDAEKLLRSYEPHDLSGCRVLVTSRRGYWRKPIFQYTLNILDDRQSIELLQKYCDWLSEDEAANIAKELGGLPLALRLAGSYLDEYRGEPLADIAFYLKQIQTSRTQHTSLNQEEQGIIATFSLSFQRLNPDIEEDTFALDALNRAAYFMPGELFPRKLLSDSLGGLSDDPIVLELRAKANQRLIKLGLLELNGKELRLHRLLAAYVQENLVNPQAQLDVEAALIQEGYRLTDGNYIVELRLLINHLRYAMQQAQGRVDLSAIQLLDIVACYEYQAANYLYAQELLEQAWEMCQRIFEENNVMSARILNDLALILDARGNSQQAQEFFLQALRIREKVCGIASSDTATSLNNLANLYVAQGLYDKAEPLLLQALDIRKQLLGTKHLDTATSLRNLALLYVLKGQYNDAEPLYLQALQTYEMLLGTQHTYIATTLNYLGLLYVSLGQYARAEEHHYRALYMRESLLNAEHPDIAHSLNDLAILQVSLGHYNEAELLHKRALRIREHILGNEHVDTASSFNNLALLYKLQGQYGDAEKFYLRAIHVYDKNLDKDHLTIANSLNNLAGLYVTQGRYIDAEPLYHRALKIYEKVLGSEHLDTANLLDNLAGLYVLQGRSIEAEPLYLRTLNIREQVFGTHHPSVVSSLNNLATLYQSEQQYDKAEELYQQALYISETVLGNDHPDTATFLNNLAYLYFVRGLNDKAEELYQRALSIRKNILGTDHPLTASTLNNLAHLYQGQGRYDDAAVLYKQALHIQEQTLGIEHTYTQNTRKALQLNQHLADLLLQVQTSIQQALSEPNITRQDLVQQIEDNVHHFSEGEAIGSPYYMFAQQLRNIAKDLQLHS